MKNHMMLHGGLLALSAKAMTLWAGKNTALNKSLDFQAALAILDQSEKTLSRRRAIVRQMQISNLTKGK